MLFSLFLCPVLDNQRTLVGQEAAVNPWHINPPENPSGPRPASHGRQIAKVPVPCPVPARPCAYDNSTIQIGTLTQFLVSPRCPHQTHDGRMHTPDPRETASSKIRKNPPEEGGGVDRAWSCQMLADILHIDMPPVCPFLSCYAISRPCFFSLVFWSLFQTAPGANEGGQPAGQLVPASFIPHLTQVPLPSPAQPVPPTSPCLPSLRPSHIGLFSVLNTLVDLILPTRLPLTFTPPPKAPPMPRPFISCALRMLQRPL